jgi:hypothetical protein
MLKIGVLGAGHLGKIHLKCIKEIPEYDLIGFFDSDEEISKAVERNMMSQDTVHWMNWLMLLIW